MACVFVVSPLDRATSVDTGIGGLGPDEDGWEVVRNEKRKENVPGAYSFQQQSNGGNRSDGYWR